MFLAFIFKGQLLVQHAASLLSCQYCPLCMCRFASASWRIKWWWWYDTIR